MWADFYTTRKKDHTNRGIISPIIKYLPVFWRKNDVLFLAPFFVYSSQQNENEQEP
jgi:hypothetical protein